MSVKITRRQKDDLWKFEMLKDPENELQFYSVDIKITLKDIYEGIELLSKK